MTSPAPVVISGAHQLTVKLMQGGQPAAVVLGGVRTNGVPGQDDGIAWLDCAWNVLLKGGMTGDVTCIGGVMRSLTGTGFVNELPAPATPTGTQGAAQALAAAAWLVKWNTSNGSRSGKGRTFVPGIPPSSIVGGRTIAAASLTQLQGQVTAYLADARVNSPGGPTGIKAAVLSRKNLTAYPITSGSVSSTVAIQRRRMRA